MTIYNTNLDLVIYNVYTKFGLSRSIHFQDIDKKLKYDRMTQRENDGQGESSIAPTFSKRGYN